jgi:hypothetical protein
MEKHGALFKEMESGAILLLSEKSCRRYNNGKEAKVSNS